MKIFNLILLLIFLSSNLNTEMYDRVLVVINNESITLFDLNSHYLDIREELIRMGQNPPQNLKATVFDSLINQKLIKQHADAKELFVSESEIDEAIENLKASRRLSDEALKSELKKVGKTIEELREDYKNQILTEKVISIEVRSMIEEPTEEELREYYNKHKKEMYNPPRIKVKHILIMDNPNASLSAREKLKNTAMSVLKKALAGENFERLAREYSDDTASAPLGGDIGYISRGEWLPEIDEHIFKLKKGQISPQLLYSRWGWHIVKVVDKKPRTELDFDDVKFHIKNRIIAEKMDEKYKEWMEIQKSNSYIEVILENNEKYVYYSNRWKKKNGKEVISNEELYKCIENLSL